MLCTVFYLDRESVLGLISAYPTSDAGYYYYQAFFAVSISEFGGMLDRVIPFSPYLELLKAGFRWFGVTPTVMFLLNAMMLVGTSIVMPLLTAQLGHRNAALLSGLLFSLTGVMIFYAGLSVKSSFVLFGTSCALLAAATAIQRQSWWALFLSILLICITALDRDNLLIIIPPVIWFFSQSIRHDRRIGRTIIPLILATALSFVLFFTVQQASHKLAIAEGIRNSLSVNFLAGHGIGAKGGFTKVDTYPSDIVGMRLVPLNLSHEIASQTDKSQPYIFHTLGMEQWWNHYSTQLDALAVLKLKHTAQMFAQYGYGAPELYPLWRWNNWGTRLAIVDWSVLVALLLTGLLCFRSVVFESRSVQMLFWSGVLYGGTVWTFIIVERYRLPLYLFATPIAAIALLHLFRERSSKTTALCFSFFIVSIGLNQILDFDYGSGWPKNPEFEKLRLEKRVDSERDFYQLMSVTNQSSSYEDLLSFAETLMHRNFHYDSLLVLNLAEKSEDIQVRRQVFRTRKMVEQRLSTSLYQIASWNSLERRFDD